MLKNSRLLVFRSARFFGKIKNGQDLVLEDGTEIKAADYISAPRPGKIITILGDTRKTDASVRLAVNADVLVHESTYGKGDEKLLVTMVTQLICKLHK